MYIYLPENELEKRETNCLFGPTPVTVNFAGQLGFVCIGEGKK